MLIYASREKGEYFNSVNMVIIWRRRDVCSEKLFTSKAWVNPEVKPSELGKIEVHHPFKLQTVPKNKILDFLPRMQVLKQPFQTSMPYNCPGYREASKKNISSFPESE